MHQCVVSARVLSFSTDGPAAHVLSALAMSSHLSTRARQAASATPVLSSGAMDEAVAAMLSIGDAEHTDQQPPGMLSTPGVPRMPSTSEQRMQSTAADPRLPARVT